MKFRILHDMSVISMSSRVENIYKSILLMSAKSLILPYILRNTVAVILVKVHLDAKSPGIRLTQSFSQER